MCGAVRTGTLIWLINSFLTIVFDLLFIISIFGQTLKIVRKREVDCFRKKQKFNGQVCLPNLQFGEYG